MTTRSVFQEAINTLNEAGRICSINERVMDVLQEPKRIFQFRIPLKMDDGSFHIFPAYRVHYCDAMGPFRDGTRIRPGLTLDEIKALGIFMTIKHCVAEIPAGGAKGGIQADPAKLTSSELERLIRAYVRNLQPKGPWVDVPGADIGTGEQAMVWMLDEYEQLTGQHCPAAINDKPYLLGGSQGGAEATGRGVFISLKAGAEDLGLDLKASRVAVQGFGQVGAEVASLLFESGCSVVAVSDVHGGVHAPDGLDLPSLKRHMAETGKVPGFSGGRDISNEELLECDCDILVPAAVQNVIHEDNASRIKARLIVEGANGPVTTGADKTLLERGVTIVPDVVANSGGATVCHFERTQGLSDAYWDLETVRSKLMTRISQAYQDAARTASDMNVKSLRLGAWMFALQKLEQAMQLRGWV